MTDLFHDMLNHLTPYHANTWVNVTDFVKPYIIKDDNENTLRLLKIFDSLKSKNLFDIELTEGQSSSVTPVNKQGQDFVEQRGQTIGRFTIKASITNDGLHYLEQKERDKRQDELTDSVKTTNYWVKRASIASTVIAFLTLLYIALDYYKSAPKTDISPLTNQLKESQRLLDSIRISQKEIGASLRTLAYDSLKDVLIQTKEKPKRAGQ